MRKLKDILMNINLSTELMVKLIEATDLFGKLNTKIVKFKNPYILTYLLEGLDAINSNRIENIFSTIEEGADEYIANNDHSPYVRYRESLKEAHKRLAVSGIIRPEDIQNINKILRANNAGFRKTPVTIKDENGNIIHTGINAGDIPAWISDLLENLNGERNINKIVEALIIHHQFEYIHPFGDGNGRTGRILLSLMFYHFGILEIPASVISYSIYREKAKYYKALQDADKGNYNAYLFVMLEMLIDSLKTSLAFADELLKKINIASDLEINIPDKVKTEFIMYCFTGIKISNNYLVRKLKMNNKTISKYVNELEKVGILKKERIGKFAPYKNLVIEKLILKHFNEE